MQRALELSLCSWDLGFVILRFELDEGRFRYLVLRLHLLRIPCTTPGLCKVLQDMLHSL